MVGFTENDTPYYYIKNLQGDVIKVVNRTGYVMGTYNYDAWGNLLSIDYNWEDEGAVTRRNPIRYRGYYYDTETELYYLNSRYYSAEMGRFLNADGYASTGQGLTGSNMFAYCGNNPIIRADDGGNAWNIVIGAAVGGLASGVIAGITSYHETGKVDWGSVGINAIVGAVSGAVAATGLGIFAQAGITAAVSGIGNVAEQIHTNKGLRNFSVGKVAGTSLLGGVTSAIGSVAGKYVGKHVKDAADELLRLGRGKYLTGVLRRSVGQSSSAFFRQANKLIAQGTYKMNWFKGICSSVGSGIGVFTTNGYNHIVDKLYGW